ncbi:MAG: FAD-binding oxidoreductase [Chloroflexota bacterium]|nr:FAD-binding oxidoreductase [Chloroflexota bacterium]
MKQLQVDRRSALDLPRSAGVVVIGGGIAGIATAWFLRQRGVSSIIVEAASDIGMRTTSVSAHCIRAQFGEPDNIRMMAESLAFYERFAERCGLPASSASIGLCQQGYLFASTAAADRSAFRDRVERQGEAGLDDVELLDGDEVRQRYPWLSDEIVVATFRGRDGWIDSGLAVEALAATAQVPIYLNVTVERIRTGGGRVQGIETSGGFVAANMVVLAAGPFSRELSPERLPIALWRRHRVIVAPNASIPQSGPVTIDANTGAHWRPHQGGALLAWAQPEANTEATWPVEPEPGFIDLILRSNEGVGRLAPFWRELTDRLSPGDLYVTAGQYTMTPDHRPLIGPAPNTPGLYLHTGYSGHGIMGSPAGARILADVIVSGHDRGNSFSPSRFDGNTPPPDVEQVVL